MIKKTLCFLAVVAFVAASCHDEPDQGVQCNQKNIQWSGCRGDSPVSREAQEIKSVIASNPAEESLVQSANGRIVSNKCDCVKTILRHKPVTRVSVVPTERRQIEILQRRPITQQIKYNYNPPLNTGPSYSSNIESINDQIQTFSNYQPHSSLSLVGGINGVGRRINIEQCASQGSIPQYVSFGNGIIGESYSGLDSIVPQAEVARSSQPARIVSNNCNCVKTILRHKPVRRVSLVPTERRIVQTFTKPVIKRFQYNFNPALETGPAPQVRLDLGSVSSPYVSDLNQPIENIAEPIQVSGGNCLEINAQSIVPSDVNSCGSRLENLEGGLENLSQLPSC